MILCANEIEWLNRKELHCEKEQTMQLTESSGYPTIELFHSFDFIVFYMQSLSLLLCSFLNSLTSIYSALN